MKKTLIFSSMAVFLLFNLFLTVDLSAQSIPYVYSSENTGSNYAPPPLPTPATAPTIQYLPDPFAWPDGSGSSTAFSDWEHHRNDFMAYIENYEIGTKPVVDKASQVTASYSGNTLTINITANGQSMTMTCAVSIPSGATAPYPVCIGMNSSYGSLNSSDFTSRGIVGITFSHDQVTTYGSPSTSDPFFRLYPSQNPDNTGQYAAWAWGVSRIIDGLEKVKAAGTFNVDLNHICVTGCSYAGKMALFSGAFDERVALTIAQESGGGGATSWRYSATEPSGTVEWIPNTDYNWFKNDMSQWGGSNVTKMPDDHHMLMAMCAPRALYCTGNTDYTWLSNPSCYVCGMATSKIYTTLGIADRFGFNVDGGHSHCAFPSDQESDVQYFLDKFMKGQTSLSKVITTHPSSYSTINYAQWTANWSTGTSSNLSVSPTSVTLAAAANSTGTFSVSSNVSWTVSSNQSWLSVSPTSGSNNGSVTVTATQNTGSSSRSATVTVSATGATSQTVTVTQNGAGGSSDVNINVGGSATGNFSADQYGSGGSTYTNSATIDMSQITSNPPPAAIFSTERYGAFTYTIPNRVAGSAQTVTLYFAETYVTAAGQRLFDVSINGTTVLSSFDIYAAAGGENIAIARSFNTTANSSGQVVIQFISGTQNPKVNGISVAAGSGGGSTLSVTPTTLSVAAATNSTGTFSVSSNTSWTVSSNQTWLTVSPTSGSNNGTVTVTAAQNTGSSRSATVTVSATGATSQTVTVTQAAAASTTLSVSPTSLSVAAAASSTGTFNVTSNTSWSVSSSQSWLTVSPTSGSNNGTVTVTAAQNTGTSSRSATVTVSATGATSQTVTVTQSAASSGSSNTVSINVGGSATGSFSADQYGSGGSTYTNSATIDMSQITSNPPPAAVFNTERYGAFTYTIPNRAPGSAQTVTLYFAETYVTAAGQRLFDVSINGNTVLSSFDIYAAAGGQNIAIARSFNTTANSSGQVVIQFISGTQNPKVNGISVTGESSGGSTGSYDITVRALGTSGSEQISLTVGGTTVQSWTLTTSYASYTATTSDSGPINVQFTNDNGTSRDVQVDYIVVAGTTEQAEDQATNTGVWQNSQCGGSYSEWLQCNGYISFPAYKRAEESLITGSGQDVNIYPNPADNLITVSLSGISKDGGQISIYNSMGAQVRTMKIEGLKNNVDLTKLPSGIYIISVRNGDININKKFIKR